MIFDLNPVFLAIAAIPVTVAFFYLSVKIHSAEEKVDIQKLDFIFKKAGWQFIAWYVCFFFLMEVLAQLVLLNIPVFGGFAVVTHYFLANLLLFGIFWITGYYGAEKWKGI